MVVGDGRTYDRLDQGIVPWPSSTRTWKNTMAPRLLDSRYSLDTLHEEVVYTLARLQADTLATDLATRFDTHGKTIAAAIQRELGFASAEVKAQACVDRLQGEMRSNIETFALDLLRLILGDRSDRRYTQLFRVSPSVLARKALTSQVAMVGTWPTVLAGDPGLAVWAPVFTQLLDAANQAIAKRSAAATERATWRSRERESMFAAVNAARQEVYGALCQRTSQKGQPRTWPDGFFRQQSSHRSDSGRESQGAPA